MANNKALLVSCELPTEIEEKLGFLGYGCVRLPRSEVLDTPVSSHPDMLFYKLPSGKLLCDGGYFEANKELLTKTGASFVFSEKHLERKYPGDVLFDAFTVGDTLFARLDAAAPEIVKSYEKTVNLKQGYAKCSTLLAGKIAVTSDVGIAKALEDHGVKVLRTEEKILLPGYGCGFIGGASFYDSFSDTVILFGEPQKNDPVPRFLEENGIRVLYCHGMPLTDFGGAVLIN